MSGEVEGPLESSPPRLSAAANRSDSSLKEHLIQTAPRAVRRVKG